MDASLVKMVIFVAEKIVKSRKTFNENIRRRAQVFLDIIEQVVESKKILTELLAKIVKQFWRSFSAKSAEESHPESLEEIIIFDDEMAPVVEEPVAEESMAAIASPPKARSTRHTRVVVAPPTVAKQSRPRTRKHLKGQRRQAAEARDKGA